MIPDNNKSHVVLSFPFDRITDLIEATRDAGILPRREPASGGWDTLDVPVARIDLGFRARFRAELGPMKIEAWQPAAAPEFRFGATITILEFVLEAYELSTGTVLTDIDFAVSGRIYISGILQVSPSDQAVFFILQRVRATPDDTTAGLPTPWPGIAIPEILSRIADRTIRAQLLPSGNPLQRRLPINPVLNTGGLVGFPLQLNYIPRDEANIVDWLSYKVCLPSGIGNQACAPGAGQIFPFFNRLDVYANAAGTNPPDHVNLVGRQFQIDVGINLLRQALMQHEDSSWHGDKKYFAFRFTYDLAADFRPWPGATDGSIGIWFGFTGIEYVWYPKIKWCDGSTLGVKYKYPCGIEDGWAETQRVTIEMMFRLYADASGGVSRICIERTQLRYDVDENLWGRLYEFIMTALIDSIPIIGPIVSTAIVLGEMLIFFVLLLADLVAKLIDAIVPNQFCASLGKTFATLPIINDRVDALLSNAFLEMKTNGITIALDGHFEKRQP